MELLQQDLFEQGPVICFSRQLSPGWPVLQVTNNIHQFGYQAADFLAQELLFTEIVHPDDLARVTSEVTKNLAQDIAKFEQDYRIITKNGEVRWVYDKTILKRDMSGGTVHATGYLLDITDRKLAELQPLQSSKQHSQLFKSNKAIELIIDPDSRRIVKANKAAAQFYGYNKQELEQLLISDINILPPVMIKIEIARALAEQRDYFNFRHRLKSGEIRDVCVYSGPITLGGRKLLYSVVYDISEQRQAESALLKSEQKFRSFIETTSEGFLILTPQIRIDFVNAAFCQLTGYSLDELKGRSLSQLVTAESSGGLQKQLSMVQVHTHQSSELILQHKNGNEIFVRCKATSMTDGAGIFAFVTDITAQRVNEIQLKKLSSAVRHCASSIIITDKEGVIEYVNPRFCDVTGYSEAEAIGQAPGLIRTLKTSQETAKELWTTILAGNNWHGETYNRTKNDDCYWSMTSISPIKDEKGQISHFVSVSEDITKHKSQQFKMEQLALSDPLTGVANRRSFDAHLSQATETIRLQNCTGIGLVMLDLDYFKNINDTHGHNAGDILLKEVANQLLKCTRKEDTVSRLGGDEFTILLRQVRSEPDVQRVAQDILEALRQPIRVGDYTFSISCSLGICIAPQHGTTPAQLLKNADLALYQAKKAGRNNIQFYDLNMQ